MKKIFFALLLVCSGFLLQKADAQVRVGVNLNVGAQPDWGPYGYDYAQFYYFPDIDVYYDVANQQFVYFDGYDWRYSPSLPYTYNDFDLYGAYKVVINEPRPYLRADYYRGQYYSYRGYHNQPVLRDYRNRGYSERGDERFEHRNEQYENRDQRFETRNQPERNDRGGFEQRNSSGNRGGNDQRGYNQNRNITEQRNNDNIRNEQVNRNDQVNGNNRFGANQNTNSNGRTNGNERFGSMQRNGDRNFERRH